MSRATQVFLGAWVASVVGAGLIAVLVLGRAEPTQSYDLEDIALIGRAKYAAANRELAAGAVLYQRMELAVPGGVEISPPGVEFSAHYPERIVLEMWSQGSRAESGAAQRIEYLTMGDEPLHIIEVRAGTQRGKDVASGFEWSQPWESDPREPALGRAVAIQSWVAARESDFPLVDLGAGEPLSGFETRSFRREVLPGAPVRETFQFDVVVLDPELARYRAFDLNDDDSKRLTSEQVLVAWAVLPAGTEFGTRP